MRFLMTATGREFFQAVDDLRLSLSQIKMLTLLGEADEGAAVKRLAEQLGLSMPAASRAVDGLVKRGLATRIEDPDDRRCKQVSVTAAGRRTWADLIAKRLAGIERFVDALEPAERDALAAGLAPIVARDDVSHPTRKRAR